MDGDIDNTFQSTQNDLKAEQMRQEDAEAMARLREYIAEHRGNMLALNLMCDLYELYKSGH